MEKASMSKRAVLLIAATLFLTAGCQRLSGPRAPESTGSPQAVRAGDSRYKGWSLFTAKYGGFSVMLPGKPTATSLESGEAQGTGLTLELQTGEFKYLIVYRDYPASVIESSPAKDQHLQMTAEKAIALTGGKLLSSKPVSLGEYPGREVKSELNNGFTYSRRYLVKQRLYLLMLSAPDDKAGSENAAKFFDSFKLVPAE